MIRIVFIDWLIYCYSALLLLVRSANMSFTACLSNEMHYFLCDQRLILGSFLLTCTLDWQCCCCSTWRFLCHKPNLTYDWQYLEHMSFIYDVVLRYMNIICMWWWWRMQCTCPLFYAPLFYVFFLALMPLAVMRHFLIYALSFRFNALWPVRSAMLTLPISLFLMVIPFFIYAHFFRTTART
jgi:hypothetical protein